MAVHGPITSGYASGTYPPSFLADADALDVIIDRLHVAIMAEAAVSKWFDDIALSSFAEDAANEWAACATATMAFLSRPNLHASHVLGAEHLLDVLQDQGLDGDRLRGVPVALMSAAAQSGARTGLADLILTRQLSHLAGVLRTIIEESAFPEDPGSDPDHGAAPV